MFPTNLKLRGVDLQVNDPRVSGNNFQQSYWLMVNDNSADWIRPQIDAAISLGANAIGIICDTGNIVSGRYVDQATFIARATLIADYCLSRGLYFFPTLCNGVEIGDEGNLSLIAPLAQQLAAALSQRPNVIGFDLWAEIQGDINQGQFDNARASTLLAGMQGAVKAVCNLPCAASVVVFGAADWTSSIWGLVDSYSDFWLPHIYHYIPGSTDPNQLMIAYGTRPLLVGEVGSNQSEGTSFQTQIYNAIANILNQSGCVGGLAWSLCDGPATDAPDQYGLFSGLPGSFSPRVSMTTPFSLWPSSGLESVGTGTATTVMPTTVNFKFGTTTSPVPSGYIGVNETTIFSQSLGYGWSSGTIQSRDRNSPDPLHQSFDFTSNGVFTVNLPNGSYDVTLICGDDEFPQGPMEVWFQGSQVDSFTTVGGQFTIKTYVVVATNGQLTLQIIAPGGTSPYGVINAMQIAPAQVTEPTATWPVTLTGAQATATAQQQSDGSWKIIGVK